MKKILLVEIIACLFFLLFVYTAISKILAFDLFVFDLGRDPLIGNYATILGISIPLIELLISASLFIPKLRKAGLWSSFILMTLFTVYVGLILAFKDTERHCTCGGFIRQMSWWQHLWFNIILMLIALLGLYVHNKINKEETNQFNSSSIHQLKKTLYEKS